MKPRNLDTEHVEFPRAPRLRDQKAGPPSPQMRLKKDLDFVSKVPPGLHILS